MENPLWVVSGWYVADGGFVWLADLRTISAVFQQLLCERPSVEYVARVRNLACLAINREIVGFKYRISVVA